MSRKCPDCRAQYDNEEDSCERRFEALLALDHSREEPWGSRHAIAFAVYALQHPRAFEVATLDRCWAILYRVYVKGDEALKVARALTGDQLTAGRDWDVPPRPEVSTPAPRITIKDLGHFPAAEYSAMLDAWAQATVAWLNSVNERNRRA